MPASPSMTHPLRVLFVDAYDSFAANIIALLRRLLCADVTTIKIDTNRNCLAYKAQNLQSFLKDFDAIVLGPGPGNPIHPSDVGLFPLIWKHAAQAQIPVLGICLGFQSLCVSFGLPVSRLDLPCHGHAKVIRHHDDDVFEGSGLVVATCYNSLGVRMINPTITPDISRPASSASSRSCESNLSVEGSSTYASADAKRNAESYEVPGIPLRVLAYDDYGYVMAITHRSLPFWGFQFHPESCKSNANCDELLKTWWAIVQRHNSKYRPGRSRHLVPVPESQHQLGVAHVTSSLAFMSIVDCLRKLTTSIEQTPRYKKLPLSIGRQQLADLCHSLSPVGSIAMLESTKRARFSIFACPHKSTWHLAYQNAKLCISKNQAVIQQQTMPLGKAMKLIEDFLSQFYVADGEQEIPFWGGFIGCYSYEAGLDLLDVSTADNRSSRTIREISLMWVDRSVVVDHEKQTITVQSIRRNDDIWLGQMSAKVRALGRKHLSRQETDIHESQVAVPAEKVVPSHGEYISKIRSCQSSLHAGDSYELCFTTSATLTSNTPPYALYSSLQQTNPAPYAAYLHLLNTHILCSSPEQFLSWSRVTPFLDMKPMKGTLSKSPTIDTVQKAREILLNPKEEAENLMIADLIRHDLHTALGSDGHVTVEKLFEIVETESLYQLVSHIRGHIAVPTSASEQERRLQIMRAGHRALRTALPAGSMTGAPKKRSCEILRSLEQRSRGVYSGVIGYFDVGGGGEWSVAIRCAFSHDSEDTYDIEEDDGAEDGAVRSETQSGQEKRQRKWHVGAGGAITVLSDEEAEWEEMRAKMGSVLRGFGVRE